jgi:glycosyltransferase involved in cell wall biosynthesis
MPLTVLSIGYSLAPVGPDVAGGAEQVLSALDRALVAAGHRSIVIAPQGSDVAGTLVATAPVPVPISDRARQFMRQRQRAAIAEALSRWPVDLIHMHGLDFAEHLPEPGIPTLVTLHLPAEFYPSGAISLTRPRIWFNCVSEAQRRTFPPLPNMLPPVSGGVPVEQLRARHAKRNFALALGRICPEKGFHLALDAAGTARVPLLIAGQVFPYPDHQRYFDEQIRPRLRAGARFLGPVGFARKRRLLSAARCVLLPSLVAETGSLVAMEALACGTPVIAFPAGALAEIVEPGVTGFLVAAVREMAEAILAAARIDPEACRAAARARFSLGRMVERYFAVYERLAVKASAPA